MANRPARLAAAAVTAVTLFVLVVGVPAVLWRVAGWPFPATMPNLGEVATAIDQRNIPGRVVVAGLAIVIWVLWAQLVWALIWELAVNGRRLARGLRTRPAPFVAGPINSLVVRLVSGTMAATVAITAASGPAVLPSPAAASTIDLDRASPDVPPPATAHTAATGDVGDPMPRGGRWVVGEGDSLWSIAETTLGDGGRSGEILALNPTLASARDVTTGVVLWVPVGSAVPRDRIPGAEVEATGGLAVGDPEVDVAGGPVGEDGIAVEVEVVPGDNLWNLSAGRLGAGTVEPDPAAIADYLADVVDINRSQIDDPDLIFPGQVLAFPVTEPAPEPAGPEGLQPLDWCADGDGSGIVPPDPGGGNRGGSAPLPGAELPATDTPGVGGTPADGAGAGVGPGVIDGRGDVANPAITADGGGSPDGSGEDRRPGGDGDRSSLGVAAAFGVAGALLAAGALDLVRRRRRYRHAHRTPGMTPAPPPADLAPIERALVRQADPDGWVWVDRAMRSLASRPVWEGEEVAQPVLARISAEELEVTFTAPDPMAGPLPWESRDEQLRWAVARSVALGQLPEPDVAHPLPTLVTLGTELMVNLEGLGVLALVGTGDGPMGLVRSIVHELATSPSAGSLDIRSTIDIDGIDSYRLVRRQHADELVVELSAWLDDTAAELARCRSANAYGHRLLLAGSEPAPVVVVTDGTGAERLEEIVERAADRRLPIGMVVVGDPIADAATVTLDGAAARLEPWGIELDPQLLTADRAERLGRLLTDAATGVETPVVIRSRVAQGAGGDERAARFGPWADVVTIDPGGPNPDRGTGRPEATSPMPSGVATSRLGDAFQQVGAVGPGPNGIGSTFVAGGVGAPAPVGADIDVSLLGEIEVRGVDEELTSQQLSLISFLAFRGSSPRDTIIDALWDGQAISKSRFPNLLAETRARIGRHHFPEARDGRYGLRGVTTDLARFEAGLETARAQDGDDVRDTLRSILALVRGTPLTAPSRRFWTWVADHSHEAARVEAMVADTAVWLATIEQERGDLEAATWSCERGLAASPIDETLVITLTEVYLARGRIGLARRLVDDWEDRIGRLDCGEPSDEPRRRLAG